MHVMVVCLCSILRTVRVWFDLCFLRCLVASSPKVPQLSWVTSLRLHTTHTTDVFLLQERHYLNVLRGLFSCRLISTMTRTIAWWILWGAQPSPGTDEHPEATVLIQTTSSPDMPPRCPRASLGMPSFCCSWKKEGWGGAVDWAVGDGHPDYASSYGLFTLDTKQYGRHSIAPQQQNCTHWGCQPVWFNHIISWTVTCSPGRSCDLLVRTNRVARLVLGRAKGRGGKKILFPLRFLILQQRKWSSSTVSCTT